MCISHMEEADLSIYHQSETVIQQYLNYILINWYFPSVSLESKAEHEEQMLS